MMLYLGRTVDIPYNGAIISIKEYLSMFYLVTKIIYNGKS